MRRKHRRNPREVNLVFGNLGLLAVVGIVAFLGYRKLRALYQAGQLNPASRQNVVYQAVGEPGLKIADWLGGAFKSDAEKAVDAMLTQQVKPVPDLTRNLSYGMAGTDVRLLQELLGMPYRDGVFGDQVMKAVRGFQAEKGLVVDGIVGPATWNALRYGRAIVTQTGQLITGSNRDLIR